MVNFDDNVTNVHLIKIKNLALTYIISLIMVASECYYRCKSWYQVQHIRISTISINVKKFCIEHIKHGTLFNKVMSLHKKDIDLLNIHNICINRAFFIKHLKYRYNCTLQIIKNIINDAYDKQDQNYKLFFDDVIINNEINYEKLIDKTFDIDVYNIIALPTIKNNNDINAIQLNIKQLDPNMILVIDV